MDIVSQRKPLRILVVLYPQSPLMSKPEIDTILHQSIAQLNAIESDARALFLATWPHRTVMVFDLCNENYDFAQAHQPQDLPVLAIHFQTKEKIKIGKASEPNAREVNNEVARYHNLHGHAALPMVEDHRNGNVPTFMSPRNMGSPS
ncbi:hypothetical protein PMIN01_11778 [Paraphaeosphaeria minitans]|uniref:Uncharacterized protein n=1 Tax=Paraphaeosphaeria minitans TaxID=565426 RepID=A0A9P6G8N8_9PLEO|nr:hypothetical protein PMIN01_11778 [Paraphaeosphaeria minitans]